jgi:hypothetical protein
VLPNRSFYDLCKNFVHLESLWIVFPKESGNHGMKIRNKLKEVIKFQVLVEDSSCHSLLEDLYQKVVRSSECKTNCDEISSSLFRDESHRSSPDFSLVFCILSIP